MPVSLLRSRSRVTGEARGSEEPVRAEGRTIRPRRGSGPSRERVLIRMNGDTCLLSVTLVGLLSGTWAASGTLPDWLYYTFAVAQIGILGRLIRRGNLLCAAMGFCFTAMLLIGVLISGMWRPYSLNGTFAGSFLAPSLTALANRILLLTSCLYYALVFLLAPARAWKWRSADFVERSAARLGTWPLLVSGAVLGLLTQHGELVTSVSYPSNVGVNAGVLFSNSGLDLLGIFFITFGLVAACRGYGFSSRGYRWSLAGALALITYLKFLRGDRGETLGVVSTAICLFHLSGRMSHAKKLFVSIALVIGTLLLLQVWASARATAAEVGIWRAMEEGWNHNVTQALIERFDPVQVQLLPQAYWHLLETEYLVEKGLSAHGATVYPLLAESVPESFARLIHYRRPLNSAWLIGQYGISSSGGMYVVAEAYWNFGLPGALGLAAILALIAVGLEKWYRSEEPLLAGVYFAFIGSLGAGLFYGLEPLARALEMTVALALLFRWAMSLYRSGREDQFRRLRRRCRTEDSCLATLRHLGPHGLRGSHAGQSAFRSTAHQP